MEEIKEKITVNNPHGLHVRPAAVFVQIANKFDSRVFLEKNGERVDGKSIITILSLGVHKGMEVTLIAEGNDAAQAFAELKQYLEKKDD
ncbi:MAG: HPr family phosphocarrier protein [Candidatus Omnitrophica bacterium]|nr:HPr family phosphocarrier protein [Candidatus Omnitrophota bacterium]